MRWPRPRREPGGRRRCGPSRNGPGGAVTPVAVGAAGGQSGETGDRAALDREDATVAGDPDDQAVAEDRRAADGLGPGQVVDARGVDVVLPEPQGLQVALVQSEGGEVTRDVVQGDGAGRGRGAPGEVAVEPAEVADRVSERVDVDHGLAAQTAVVGLVGLGAVVDLPRGWPRPAGSAELAGVVVGRCAGGGVAAADGGRASSDRRWRPGWAARAC